MLLSGILPSRVVVSYVFDYFIIVVLIVAFSALDKADPFHQRFSVHNASLQYPFADPERIAPWLAGVVSCAFPLVVIIIWAMLIDGLFSHHKIDPARRGYPRRGRYTFQERLWEMNAGILGLGLSVAAVITITGALKNLTGKPRPDVLARCKVDPKWIEPPVGLTSWKQCTGDPYILRDGFKSWPSGHSSTAFGGLGYLSFYLAGKLHIMDSRGEVWKTVLVLIPVLAASMVAISRIMDARHHPFDVISSSLLGIFISWISYRQYFPPLSETFKKGRAHPIRSWGREPPHPDGQVPTTGLLRAVDEEEGGGKHYDNKNMGMASGRTEDGGIMDIPGQRRRPNQPQSTLPADMSSSPPPAAYHSTALRDPEYEEDGYELQHRGKPVDTEYQPYGSSTAGARPNRQNTQQTQDFHESEDRKWGISTAPGTIGGHQLSFTPIQEEFDGGVKEYGARRGTAESSDGFVQVKPGSRGVDLRDNGPAARGI